MKTSLRIRKYKRAWRKKHRDKENLYQRRYREKNPEKIKEYLRRSHIKNIVKRRKKQKEYYLKNRLKILKRNLEYQKKNSKRLVDYKREYQRKRKLRIFEAYGGKCACCGEANKEFLAIDHVNGDGRIERKKYKLHQICARIIKENFPPRYRILCHNCNMSLGFFGYCPHKGKPNGN